MIIDRFLDFLFINCANAGLSIGNKKAALKEKRQRVKEYADRYFRDVFANLSLAEEFDFQLLHEFISGELEHSIALSFYLPYAFERKRLRESICRNAYAYAGADTLEKQKLVYQYMKMLFAVLETFYLERTENILIFNHTIDEMRQILEEVQGELSEEIKSVRTQMAQIGAKIEYKNSFMEMIDRTKQKAYNRVPFHYLNPAIRFHGREEEMAALDAFREDDRQVLFSVLTGSGGAGKSRLLFEYTKDCEYETEWEFAYLTAGQVKQLSLFHEFYFMKNLFLIIDYAGGQAEEIGKWLYAVCQCSEDWLPPKLRIILLERQGTLYDDRKSELLPHWMERLLGSGERQIRLEEIAYYFTEKSYGYFLDLQELPDETLLEIVRDYAGECSGERDNISCESIINKAKAVSNLSGVTPLTVLLVEDFILSASATHDLEYQELFDNAVKKWEMSWQQTLCDNDPELFQAVELLLIYSTAVGRISIKDTLPSYYLQALERLLELETDRVIAIICGINGSDQFDEYINPLEPDLIGEYYFLEYIRRRRLQKKKLDMLLLPLWRNSDFAEFLERCYDDFGWLNRFRVLLEHNGQFLMPDRIHNDYLDSLCLFLFHMACKPYNRYFGEAVAALTGLVDENPENEATAITFLALFNNLQKEYFDRKTSHEIPEIFYFLYRRARKLRDRYLDDENKMEAYASAVFILAQNTAAKQPDFSLKLLKELAFITMRHKNNFWIPALMLKAICCYGRENRDSEFMAFLPFVLRICGRLAKQENQDIKLLVIVLRFFAEFAADPACRRNLQNKAEDEEMFPLMAGEGFVFYTQNDELFARMDWNDFHNPQFLQENFGTNHVLAQLLQECFDALEHGDINRAKQSIQKMSGCFQRNSADPFPVFAYAVALFSLSNAQELQEAVDSIMDLREEAVRSPEITDLYALSKISLLNQAERLAKRMGI